MSMKCYICFALFICIIEIIVIDLFNYLFIIIEKILTFKKKKKKNKLIYNQIKPFHNNCIYTKIIIKWIHFYNIYTIIIIIYIFFIFKIIKNKHIQSRIIVNKIYTKANKHVLMIIIKN